MYDELKTKIIEFLQSNPQVSHRRTPINIANHIGETDEPKVRKALQELVMDGVVKHRLVKNMQYWIPKSPQ